MTLHPSTDRQVKGNKVKTNFIADPFNFDTIFTNHKSILKQFGFYTFEIHLIL